MILTKLSVNFSKSVSMGEEKIVNTKNRRTVIRSKRINEAVEYLVEYIQKYEVESRHVPDRTDLFIQDMLYGIGCSINPRRYQYLDGYDRFLGDLEAFIRNMRQ